MSVTIDREDAQEYARQVRAVAARLPRSETGKMLSALADLIDPPPPPSLRDEVADTMRIARVRHSSEWAEVADAALVRLERVLNLPRIEWNVRLDDLIALFGDKS